MKKNICILIAASLFSVLSSCRKEPDFVDVMVVTTHPDTTAVTPSNQPKEPVTTQPEGPTPVTPSFTVSAFTEETEHYKASVQYPVVSDVKNAAEVNGVIYDATRSFVMSDLSYTFVGETFGSYEINSVKMSYADDHLLSFVYNGSYYGDCAAHPIGFIRTLNIDLNAARIISASEVFADFGKLKIYFESELFTQVSSGNSQLDAERAAVNRFDLIGQYRAEYNLYPSVYFVRTTSGVGLTVSTETVYALGDHIEFVADTELINDCLSDEILKLTKGNK